MNISVVSGTYNRIKWLKQMVRSVRKSLGESIYGISCEVVLVDGGSSDGTQQWCQKQSDIMLIQHTGLLGAVKAFNDGAFASRGDYVILANDDIEFLGDSILLAYLYMQHNPDCGIGCFYQDRDGRDWHVDHMPVRLNKKQGNLPYGQVCIVPKWLGDKVGWWGDYQHTYGGDNELSANVYELGMKVSPIPGTKIHDHEANDDLRKMNNITGGKDPRAVRGHHPDSWAWGKKWRDDRTGLVGPTIKDAPIIDYERKVKIRERVLYLPIFEPGWDIQKEQKRGLRDALAKIGVVTEYDYFRSHSLVGKKKMMEELIVCCQRLKPTIVLTQLHNSDIINVSDIERLKSICSPGTKFVNWNGDYWPEQLLDDRALELAKVFDFNGVVNRDVVRKHRSLNIDTQYWQIGYEPDGVGHEPDVFHDIVFLASGYSPKRQRLGMWLQGYCDQNNYSLGIYGSGWKGGLAKGQTLYDFKAGCKIYRGAKIAIGDSQWPESGFVSNRIFQILAAGNCVLCHQWFKDIETLGLIDGENCIVWKDLGQLEWKLIHYLREGNLENISRKGETLALRHHSFDSRVSELQYFLQATRGVNIDEWRW